jgi:chemotaxis protein CheD
MNKTPLPERLGLPLGHVGIGDCAFSASPMLLVTVLGSCVSVTFHHPDKMAGGMFHAMLPDRGMGRGRGRLCTFADAAVDAMLERFASRGMPARELTVKIFGGANTLQASHPHALREMLDVGKKNVDAALAALAAYGLEPSASDVQGPKGRKLYFATASGQVWLSYLNTAETRRIQDSQRAG